MYIHKSAPIRKALKSLIRKRLVNNACIHNIISYIHLRLTCQAQNRSTINLNARPLKCFAQDRKLAHHILLRSLNHIYRLITRYNTLSQEYCVLCWRKASRPFKYFAKLLTSRALSPYRSPPAGGLAGPISPVYPSGGATNRAWRIRSEKGSDVGIRSTREEYLRRTNLVWTA